MSVNQVGEQATPEATALRLGAWPTLRQIKPSSDLQGLISAYFSAIAPNSGGSHPKLRDLLMERSPSYRYGWING
ncbi:MAG: hypothetical protein WBA99_05180 [Nodosilinea sp.]